MTDSQIIEPAGEDKALWPFCLLLLLSFNVVFAQETAFESSELTPTPSVSESISPGALMPLWGGPTSFDPMSSGLDPVANPVISTSLHHFDLACERCHDVGISEEASGFDEGALRSEVDINVSCTLSGCHDYDSVLNHPVDISPTGFVPEDLPLDSFDRITCLTCHEPETSASENPSKDRPLHIPDGMDFCSSCHSHMSGTSKEQSHWQFSTKAHLESISPNPSSQITELPSGLLDPESQSCLSCHEGITASLSGETGISQPNSGWNHMANHPIGMNYSNVVSRNALKYNNLSSVNLDIRLFDGKMGCGSCHSLYSDINKNLVQDNTGSRLCFECHNM